MNVTETNAETNADRETALLEEDRLAALTEARGQSEDEFETTPEGASGPMSNQKSSFGIMTREHGAPLLLLGAAKDVFDWLVDLVGIGEIPFVGQIPGFLFTLLIAFYLLRHGLLRQPALKRALAYGGFIADNLPILNNFPLMTIVLWFLRWAPVSAPRPPTNAGP